MPVTVPPFTTYQAPLIAVPGWWNARPVEGDRIIGCEIDWTAPGTGAGLCVQVSVSAFSPVEFSRIAAIAVDNGRNGSGVEFLFPDTGQTLSVPPYGQGTFPVYTNAKTFYVLSPQAGAGDVTTFGICNSVPPPVAIEAAEITSQAVVAGISTSVAASTVLIPAGITGTLTGFSITVGYQAGAGVQTAGLYLRDGSGNNLWAGNPNVGANAVGNVVYSLSGLDLRFYNGLNLIVAAGTNLTGSAAASIYYSVP